MLVHFFLNQHLYKTQNIRFIIFIHKWVENNHNTINIRAFMEYRIRMFLHEDKAVIDEDADKQTDSLIFFEHE